MRRGGTSEILNFFEMPITCVFCWALLFILRLRFPHGTSIAGMLFQIEGTWKRIANWHFANVLCKLDLPRVK